MTAAGDADRRTVRVDREGPLAQIVLDNPEQGNILTLRMAEQLRDAVREVAAMEGIRCVVLRGEGRWFCVGGDIAEFDQAPIGDRINEVVALPLHDALDELAALDAPVISVVQGATGGGGTGLALAGDMVIAADTTFFRTGYGLIGLSPDCGVSWSLARAFGVARAMELYVTNRKFSAADCQAVGLITRVVPEGELQAATDELVAAVLAGSAEANAATKRLMRQALLRDRSTHMADEASTIGDLGDKPAAREGFAAFLAKRPPQFG